MEKLLCFIGFGEGAYNISLGLKSEGMKGIAAYDVFAQDPEKGELIRQRALETGVTLFTSAKEAVADCKFVISATSAKIAGSVAQTIIPFLSKEQIYVDINAASPTVMEEINEISKENGILFCDVAVMGIIPSHKHKVPLLLCGDGAAGFYAEMSCYNMNLTDLKASAGSASAIKMFRSVFMKGFTQLLIETMSAAGKFGVLPVIVNSLNGQFKGKTIEDLANELIPRTSIHAARRVSEMNDVISTLIEMGLDSSMSQSTKKKLEKIVTSDIAEKLNNVVPKDYEKAIHALLENGACGI